MATLVVAAQEEEGVGVPDLETPEVEHALDAKVATIDVVPEEEVACVGRIPADFE